ncbi:hypothetical protein QQS21_000095 [Conoideocrella luteorostrata]|uniref:Uncharacterized protein n=1 Tax=Conoideocrella luteorostrata TaxID=1105319 RepID=A0AAJ0D1H2_9HYPO|nr:hypothetical protein QQS21_000095 [Conoideocrella luteorostrata]
MVPHAENWHEATRLAIDALSRRNNLKSRKLSLSEKCASSCSVYVNRDVLELLGKGSFGRDELVAIRRDIDFERSGIYFHMLFHPTKMISTATADKPTTWVTESINSTATHGTMPGIHLFTTTYGILVLTRSQLMFQTLPKAEREIYIAPENINTSAAGSILPTLFGRDFEEREYYLSCARAFQALQDSTDEAVYAYYIYQKRRSQAVSAAVKTSKSLRELMEGCTRVVGHHGFLWYVLAWNIRFNIRREYFNLRDREEIFLQGFLYKTSQADCFAVKATEADASRRVRLQVKQFNGENSECKVRFIRGGGSVMVEQINNLVALIKSQLEGLEEEGMGEDI